MSMEMRTPTLTDGVHDGMNKTCWPLLACIVIIWGSTACRQADPWSADGLAPSLRADEVRWGAFDSLPPQQDEEDENRGNFAGLMGGHGQRGNVCLIGQGLFVSRFSGVKDAAASWLREHRKAVVYDLWAPTAEKGKLEWKYVAVVDGQDILNVHLVRHGHMPADTLECGEEYRVVSRDTYEAYLERARAAEAKAKAERAGIWGDEFDYAVYIRDREKDLIDYARAVLEGRVEKEAGRINYPSPKLSGKSRIRVKLVTKDANNNVYFVTNESWVSFNVGFVYKQGPLLGDGGEDTIAREEHLFGRWWFYVAH